MFLMAPFDLFSLQVADPSDGACDAVGMGIALQRLRAMLMVSEWKEFAVESNSGERQAEGEDQADEAGAPADSNTLLRSLRQLHQSTLSLGLLKVRRTVRVLLPSSHQYRLASSSWNRVCTILLQSRELQHCALSAQSMW